MIHETTDVMPRWHSGETQDITADDLFRANDVTDRLFCGHLSSFNVAKWLARSPYIKGVLSYEGISSKKGFYRFSKQKELAGKRFLSLFGQGSKLEFNQMANFPILIEVIEFSGALRDVIFGIVDSAELLSRLFRVLKALLERKDLAKIDLLIDLTFFVEIMFASVLLDRKADYMMASIDPQQFPPPTREDFEENSPASFHYTEKQFLSWKVLKRAFQESELLSFLFNWIRANENDPSTDKKIYEKACLLYDLGYLAHTASSLTDFKDWKETFERVSEEDSQAGTEVFTLVDLYQQHYRACIMPEKNIVEYFWTPLLARVKEQHQIQSVVILGRTF